MTPALLLHLDKAKHNIELMAERMKPLASRLRPHIKCHKSPQLAKMQINAGAIGVTVATLWEAKAMTAEGITDVLIANEIVGAKKISILSEISLQANITVAVDDEQNVRELAAAARNHRTTIGILVDCDVGMGRCGVRSKEDAIRLAGAVCGESGLRFKGIMGYEGHCMLEPDPGARMLKVNRALHRLTDTVDALESSGIPVAVVSAGGTGTYPVTGAHPRVSEVQAGSYVIMDEFHHNLMPEFDVAVTVLASVISRQGSTVVLDSGRKSIGCENVMPRVDAPGIRTIAVQEEHLIAEVGTDNPIRVGDRLEVVPGYAPTTVNLYDRYHVIEQGRVSDVWAVYARGTGE